MSVPVHRMKKEKIVWLNSHKCREHGISYLSHYNCYLRENPNQERIGHLDIEASNLDADFGIILSYCIKTHGKNEILKSVITTEDLHKDLDKRITQSLINDIKKYDVLVTYYGTGFDIPFIRTRALINNLEFPNHGEIRHKDVYYIAKSKLKLSSRGLENVCRNIIGRTLKTRIAGKYWIGALRGDKQSLKYILDHNIKDVVDLEKVYNRLINFTEGKTNSI